jgi:hypothetical protein
MLNLQRMEHQSYYLYMVDTLARLVKHMQYWH